MSRGRVTTYVVGFLVAIVCSEIAIVVLVDGFQAPLKGSVVAVLSLWAVGLFILLFPALKVVAVPLVASLIAYLIALYIHVILFLFLLEGAFSGTLFVIVSLGAITLSTVLLGLVGLSRTQACILATFILLPSLVGIWEWVGLLNLETWGEPELPSS